MKVAKPRKPAAGVNVIVRSGLTTAVPMLAAGGVSITGAPRVPSDVVSLPKTLIVTAVSGGVVAALSTASTANPERSSRVLTMLVLVCFLVSTILSLRL